MKRRISPALLAVFVFVLMVAVMIPAVAAASSYYSTLHFKYQLTGSSRSYNSSNMNIALTSYTEYSTLPPASSNYTIELWRDVSLGSDDYIGYKTVPRNGYGSGRWTSVGANDYYFKFKKADDGIWVDSDSVHMYSN